MLVISYKFMCLRIYKIYMLYKMANSLTNYETDASFKPQILLSTIFGFMPFSFLKIEIGRKEKLSFQISDIILLSIWHILLITLLCCNLYIVTYSILNFTPKIRIIFIIYALLFPLTKMIIIVALNLVNYSNIPKLIKKLSIIDKFIERRKRIIMYEKIRLKTITFVFITQIILYSNVFCGYADGTALQILRTLFGKLMSYIRCCVLCGVRKSSSHVEIQI